MLPHYFLGCCSPVLPRLCMLISKGVEFWKPSWASCCFFIFAKGTKLIADFTHYEQLRFVTQLYVKILPTMVRWSSSPIHPLLHTPPQQGTLRVKLMTQTGLSISLTIGVEWGTMTGKNEYLVVPKYMYI